MRIDRAVSSFSLALAAAWSWAGAYGELGAKLHQAAGPEVQVEILRQAGIDDPDLRDLAGAAAGGNRDAIQRAVDYVDLKAMVESNAAANEAAAARKLKSPNLYRDEAAKEQANWLRGALDRLRNVIPKREPDLSGVRDMQALGGFAAALIYLVWFLLGAGVLAFTVYAVRFVAVGRLRKRKGKAMLEDDEPERTLDEWLALAGDFEREGRYREAVRALYLACLLKFDEHKVARFRRDQTNWEHLARIEGRAELPSNLRFREPTQAFDRIWYGHQVQGAPDVEAFRAWYGQVSAALEASR